LSPECRISWPVILGGPSLSSTARAPLPPGPQAGRPPGSPCSIADTLACMTMLGVVGRSLRATMELALPTTCGGCGAPGGRWCPLCARETGRQGAYRDGPRQVGPTPRPVGYPPTWAATPYDASVRAALVAFKDGDRRDLAAAVLGPMLSEAMGAALAADPSLREVLRSGNGPVLVIPVPSSPSAVHRRGDAPLELLTRAAVAQSARPRCELLVSPALRIRRRVADQAGLNHEQRAANLEYAMQVRRRWRASISGGVSCLLVDDVLTTGATLLEAARALRAGGAGHVAAAAVAATRRRTRPPDGADSDRDQ
jgi:predicted amidophosphoribosyltransferase